MTICNSTSQSPRPQAKRRSNAKKTTARFIEDAKAIHGNRYDYSVTDYKNARTDVKIRCNLHGIFEQLARGHLRGAGCHECGHIRPNKTTQQFIEDAKAIHGNRYDYSAVEYRAARLGVRIRCKTHDWIFEQIAGNHLRGAGCRKCAAEEHSGWTRADFARMVKKNSKGIATLYAIECRSGEETFYKVGITSHNVTERFKSKMPYDFEVVKEITGTAGFIYDTEKVIHRMLKSKAYRPEIYFSGYTECFSRITEDVKFLLGAI